MQLLRRCSNFVVTACQRQTPALPLFAQFSREVSSPILDDAISPENLTVVMAHTSNIDSYGSLSARINKIYCDRHGYKFKLTVDDKFDDSHWVTWEKIKHLRDILDDSSAGWAFWIDSDAIFNVQRTPLSAFMIKNVDICVCSDIFWRLGTNTGTILVRNTQWTRDFLDAWWTRANKSKFANSKSHEQSELDIMISEDTMGCRSQNKLALFPSTVFNGADWIPNPQERFILHYMSRSPEFRVKALKIKLASLQIIKNIFEP